MRYRGVVSTRDSYAELHKTFSTHIPFAIEDCRFVSSFNRRISRCKMGSASKPFPPGVHVPTLTFFHDNPRQDIDWDTQRAHLEYLIKSGVHGGMYLPISPALPGG